MVIFRSKVSTTKTGRHRGLRRGAAAVALGAVLAGTAGAPASQAAAGLSAAASTAPSVAGLADPRPRRRAGRPAGLLDDAEPLAVRRLGRVHPVAAAVAQQQPGTQRPRAQRPGTQRPRAQHSRAHGPAHQHPAVEHPARESCAARGPQDPAAPPAAPAPGAPAAGGSAGLCPPPDRPRPAGPGSGGRRPGRRSTARNRGAGRGQRCRHAGVGLEVGHTAPVPNGFKHSRLDPGAGSGQGPLRQHLPRGNLDVGTGRPVPAGRLGHRPGGALARRRRRGPPDAPELTGPASRGRAPSRTRLPRTPPPAPRM